MSAGAGFVAEWRRQKSQAFDLVRTSTAGRTLEVDFWGTKRPVYANANLSVYSAQTCNARCVFCVEELRPASRGGTLVQQKHIERNDERYFAALEQTLICVAPLAPSTSVTGGEPSKDPRLPRIGRTLAKHGTRQRTLTTNGSGLLDESEGGRIVDHITAAGISHLNISRAHPNHDRNAQLMSYRDGLAFAPLRHAISEAQRGGTQVRLSCVLVKGAIDSLPGIVAYLDFAASLGVERVIFRQLMQTDPLTVERNHVVRFSDEHRVQLEPLLDALSDDARFTFVKQIVGYYYYVEVFRCAGMTVVFEEADLAQLERMKRAEPELVHELIFHPSGQLCATWQPWDQVLGPLT